MVNIKTSLPRESAQAALNELRPVLVDLVNLGLQTKQLHWNIVGPRFRAIHLQLDELVDLARDKADDIAERIVTLGQSADAQAAVVARQSHLDPLPSDFINDNVVVTLLVERLIRMTSEMRRHQEQLRSADPVSENMVLEIIEGLEKHTWMLQAEQT